MKRFFTISILILAISFWVACSGNEDKEELNGSTDTESGKAGDSSDTSTGDTSADTGDTSADTGDTSADTGDTSADTGDTSADTGDTNADTGDTSADTGDTSADTGDTNADTGDTDTGDTDTGDTDTGDTDTGDTDTGDTDTGDTDTGDTDTGDTDTGDTDTGDTDTGDTDTGDTDTGDTDTGDTGTESDCLAISVEWESLVLYEGAYYADAAMGDLAIYDEFMIEFDHEPTIGNFNLGTDVNKKYSTCTECVRVSQDCVFDEYGYPECAKEYFQESGSLNITGTDLEGNIQGTISAKLIEVTITGAEYDFDSTPVQGGGCVEIESGKTFASTRDCIGITLDQNVTYDSSNNIYTMSYFPNTGNIMAPDTFSMKLKNPDSVLGTHNLEGTNFGDQKGFFFVIYEDNGSGRYYFQKKGQVKVIRYDYPKITAELIDVVLEEVEIKNGVSSMVPYGSCLKVKNNPIIQYQGN